MISENDQLHDLIRATKLRLRKVSPFFAALSLFSKVEFITNVPIAATDGIKIYFHHARIKISSEKIHSASRNHINYFKIFSF